MSYDNTEKISSNIMYLGSNMVLKHTVKLAHKNKSNEREIFHTEYDYKSNSYTNRAKLKSIKLSHNSFLTIEETVKDWTERQTVYIDIIAQERLLKGLKHVKKWFKKDDLFFTCDGKLIVNLELVKNEKLYQTINFGNTTVKILPEIVTLEDGEYEGVIMYINNESSYTRMTFDALKAFYKTIKRFDLYMAGLEMVNYIRRPDFDIYKRDLENSRFEYNNSINISSSESSGNVTLNSRTVDNKLKGYFK